VKEDKSLVSVLLGNILLSSLDPVLLWFAAEARTDLGWWTRSACNISSDLFLLWFAAEARTDLGRWTRFAWNIPSFCGVGSWRPIPISGILYFISGLTLSNHSSCLLKHFD